MSCKQQPLLQRLAVEEPAALKSPAWMEHLELCPECRHERYALARSLAVFRHFESQPLSGDPVGPSWERLSLALARDRRWRFSRLRLPLAAASVIVAVSTGVLLWPVTEQAVRSPSPAKLVTLKPEQHVELRRVLSSSLQPPAEAVARDGTHETKAAGDGAAGAPLLRLQGLEPSAVVPAPLLVRQEEPAPDEGPGMFGNTPTERAPVLLFRSLQQRRSRPSAVQVLPVFAPLQPDAGNLLRHSMQNPRPIR